jgi:type I restriction enzyme S subunit
MKSGYKQTEVGIIPEDWEVRRLNQILTFRNGVNADKSAYGQGVRFINVLEPITHSHIYGPEITGQVTLPESTISNYLVRKGDIVFNRTSETQDEIALAASYLGGERVVFGGFVIRGRPIDDSIEAIYAGYALRAPIIRSQIIPMGQGAVRANVGQQNLGLVWMPVPPLAEQRAIAGALSEVDALLGAQEALLAKKRDLKAAAMQQLLTGQKRLPSFTGEWEVKRLGEVAELITKGTTPTSIGQNFTESGVNFLKAESISENGSIISEKTAYIDNATHALLRRSQLKDGDLLISIAGVLGRIGTVSSDVLPANTNQALAIVRLPKNSTESRHYIFYFLRSSLIHKQINDVNVQAAQSNISLQNVADLQIHLPPPAEQTAIAAVLSDIDAEIAALEAQRDKTRTLKQGMMQELLTGRIRLL